MTDFHDLPPVTSPFSGDDPNTQPVVTSDGMPVVQAPPADDFNPDDYEYVRIDGVVRAILKTAVQNEPATSTQDAPKVVLVPVEDPHFYVWLANGDVHRVKQSDLPAPAGTNAQYGHWQVGDKVFLIVNIVPVEDIVKGDK